MTTAARFLQMTDLSLGRRLIGSLIAGMAYGMWTMLVEAILHAGESFIAGLFSPVIYIAATVLGGFGNAAFYPAGKLPPLDPIAIV